MDAALLLLRIVAGLTIAAHGAQKLFGWFGGYGLDGTAQFLGSLGFRRTKAWAFVNGLAEFGGGLLFALGLLTPLGAAAIIGVMTAATLIVHASHGFFNTEGGYEFPLLLAVVAAAVAIAGPGAYALDTALGLQLTGAAWASAAIVVGLVAGAFTAALRARAAPASARTA